jgi:hypothetical protein
MAGGHSCVIAGTLLTTLDWATSKLEQLAMTPWRALELVLDAHLPEERPKVPKPS